MNHRGQIGQIFATFPTMIIVFVIMGIFVFLSAGFSLGKATENPVFADNFATQEDLMSKQISILAPEDSEQMIVLAAIARYWAEEDYQLRQRLKGAVGLGLERIVREDAGCLFIFSAPMENPSRTLNPDYFLVRRDDGSINSIKDSNAVETNLEVLYPLSAANMRTMSFSRTNDAGARERIYVDYYYGECLYG